MKITMECVQLCRHRSRVKVVGNCDYTYQELAGLLSKVDVHAGLRTHTLIFCAAVGTPAISINAYPKSAGFLRTVGLGDWNIEFNDLSVENLSTLMRDCWEKRHGIVETMRPIVEQEKEKARDSVDLVTRILDTCN